MSTQIIVEKNVSMPMRDGTVLKGNIYRPDVESQVPALLVRTPYGKEGLLLQTFSIEAVRAAEAGYAVIYQDTRGRFASEGEFYPFGTRSRTGMTRLNGLRPSRGVRARWG